MNIDVISIVLSHLDIVKYEKVVNFLHDREKKHVLSYWKRFNKYEVKETKKGKYWYKNGKRHRDGDLPAVEEVNGYKCWYKNGKKHRDGDLPAVVLADGTKEWWKYGGKCISK